MKYKKTLLIIFFMTLFVFQQVQASANILSNDSDSQTNSVQGTGLPTQIYVNMLHLDMENDGIAYMPHEPCIWLERAEGCGEDNTQFPYPNYVHLVDVENDYLLNVLPREMNMAENNPTDEVLEALKAQALTARSLAAWKDKYISDPLETNGHINNSRDYQVFIPYAYNYYSPSSSALILEAVTSTSGQYLSYDGEAIDAEFGSDMKDRTITEPVPFPKDYLTGVEDPISNVTCGALDNSNRYGMSQLGAYRWSRGNQCATGGDETTAWPVKWDYRQILAHYYTGIDILNASGIKVVADDRWNLLKHNIPSYPDAMNSGISYLVELQLQNTSAFDWPANIILGYQWTPLDANGNPISADPTSWQEVATALPAMVRGDDEITQVTIVAPPTGGVQTLHLDLKHQGGNWFSEQTLDWPDARIAVSIAGPTATPTATATLTTPIPVTSTPIITPTTTYTPTPTSTPVTGVLTCNGEAMGVTCTNHGSYLDYNINIVVTGLTGGATAGNITIGSYTRGTSGGEMGMMSNFVHSETSGWSENTVYSQVIIQPFDAAGVGYAGFTSGAGTNVSVTNKVSDWRYIGGSGGWPNWLSIRGDVGHILTGYSIVGHIYLYSNQDFGCDCPSTCLLQESFGTLLQLLHRVKNETLSQTPAGQRYIDLYYRHGIEIAETLRINSELRNEALATLQLWEPNLQALVDGQGSSVTITSGQEQAVQTFLDHLYTLGGPQLRQTIENEQMRAPLEQTIGMTMVQAQDYLIDTIAPTAISSVLVNTNPTNAASANYTVTFSESVTGVDVGDFSLTTTGSVSGAAVSGVSGSGSTYTVTVNTGSGNGTIRLDVVDDNSIVDAALNPLGGAGVGDGDFSTGDVYAIYKLLPPLADFNGDNKADVAVFRPSTGSWHISGQGMYTFGQSDDIPVPADYNGDGKDDIAVYRPSNSAWYIYGQGTFVYGAVGDIPVSADYNGDGKADIAVFRPSDSTWYIRGMEPSVYGMAGDMPVVADYNGDGIADIAVFRPSNSTWYIKGMGPSVYGTVGDIPVIGDYNGDGKADIAVFRPSNKTWYIRGLGPSVYGAVGDIPVVGDYNGDGKADIAVFRPSNNTWYIKGIGTFLYGQSGDIPV